MSCPDSTYVSYVIGTIEVEHNTLDSWDSFFPLILYKRKVLLKNNNLQTGGPPEEDISCLYGQKGWDEGWFVVSSSNMYLLTYFKAKS